MSSGRLRGAGAPLSGERVEGIASREGASVEHIVSGHLPHRVDYLQDHDEWVVLLEGRAVLEVGRERLSLGPRDWALLPAGVAHALVEVDPGTEWLAVHFRPVVPPPEVPAG